MQDKMAWNNIETKWNADNEKFMMIMDIEKALEEAFVTYDLNNIYTLLRAYRRQTASKFNDTSRKKMEEELSSLSNLLDTYNKNKNDENKKNFYIKAEDFFLSISLALKEAGVYFREGKDASKAILQR